MIELHQSELATYRRCRRKWALSSPNMGNLISIDPEPEALWLGSGIHFALEDFHGHNRYGGLFYAFNAYYQATHGTRPENAHDLHDLAAGMFDHYEDWLSHRDDFQTLWVDGLPQVELSWSVPIPGIDPSLAILGGTFDRVITDPHGRVWILDYKTCSQFNTSKLDLDAQVSVYCFAFRLLYGYAPEGVVYVQLRKAVPEPPKILKNGRLSTDKSQNTTWDRYREALGDCDDPDRLAFLAWLRDQEDENGDRFIRRDLVRRNEEQLDACGRQLRQQAEELIGFQGSGLGAWGLYPNPTRDCAWECQFFGLCQQMDDGSDWQSTIRGAWRQREGGNNPWRNNLPDPSEMLPYEPRLMASSPLPSNQSDSGTKRQVALSVPLRSPLGE